MRNDRDMELMVAIQQLADFIISTWGGDQSGMAAEGVFRTTACKTNVVEELTAKFLKKPEKGIFSYIDDDRKTDFKFLGQLLKGLSAKLSRSLVPLTFTSISTKPDFLSCGIKGMPRYKRDLIMRLRKVFLLVAAGEPALKAKTDEDKIKKLSVSAWGLFFSPEEIQGATPADEKAPVTSTAFGRKIDDIKELMPSLLEELGEVDAGQEEKISLPQDGPLALVSDRISQVEAKAKKLRAKEYAVEADELKKVARQLRLVVNDYSSCSEGLAKVSFIENLHYIYLKAKRHPTLFRHRQAKEAVVNVFAAFFSLGFYPLINKLRFGVCFPKEKLVETRSERCVKRAISVCA